MEIMCCVLSVMGWIVLGEWMIRRFFPAKVSAVVSAVDSELAAGKALASHADALLASEAVTLNSNAHHLEGLVVAEIHQAEAAGSLATGTLQKFVDAHTAQVAAVAAGAVKDAERVISIALPGASPA